MPLLPSLLGALALCTPIGDDWPSWRGTDAQGVAAGDPPATWSETENLSTR